MKKRFVLPLILLALFSCKKHEFLGEYLLGELAYTNPYNGYETIIFQGPADTQVTFTGKGRSSYTTETYIDNYMEKWYAYETDNCRLDEEHGKFTFRITLQSHYNFRYSMSVALINNDSATFGFYSAYAGYNLPLSKQNLFTGDVYLDSLVVLNKVYYNVFVSPFNSYWYKNDSVCPAYLYYNKAFGLLKIEYSDNTSWDLKEIVH
ncbi:MAG: hypothetical protein KKA81_04265 [Bacteroidetes bacterium]|nr:hypothetical protein [Bacteroidota bacterium]